MTADPAGTGSGVDTSVNFEDDTTGWTILISAPVVWYTGTVAMLIRSTPSAVVMGARSANATNVSTNIMRGTH